MNDEKTILDLTSLSSSVSNSYTMFLCSYLLLHILEQHKRMNPRQKTMRSNQKSPGFLTEDYPQTSLTGDYGYESEPKSFTCTDEVKSQKLFPGYNPKSFSSGIFI